MSARKFQREAILALPQYKLFGVPYVKRSDVLALAEASQRSETGTREPMVDLVTSDKEVEYLDERGEVEKVSFEGLDGCTRSTQNVGGWYDTAVWWKRNFLRVVRERQAADQASRASSEALANAVRKVLAEEDSCYWSDEELSIKVPEWMDELERALAAQTTPPPSEGRE
jgi:hypothetical protein